jgi:hypothetical protein
VVLLTLPFAAVRIQCRLINPAVTQPPAGRWHANKEVDEVTARDFRYRECLVKQSERAARAMNKTL